MKYRGINYDVGNNYRQGRSSREEFDPAVIDQEIGIIHSELHCNAIRISGYDISRLVIASESALAHDLTVFFSPSNINASRKDTEDYILKGARAAEELRVRTCHLRSGMRAESLLAGLYPRRHDRHPVAADVWTALDPHERRRDPAWV